MPKTNSGFAIARQISRSGTAVGANYRAACRARSRAEMAARLAVVEEEADETLYWLELAASIGAVDCDEVADLQAGMDRFLRIVVASIRTLRKRDRNQP